MVISARTQSMDDLLTEMVGIARTIRGSSAVSSHPEFTVDAA